MGEELLHSDDSRSRQVAQSLTSWLSAATRSGPWRKRHWWHTSRRAKQGMR